MEETKFYYEIRSKLESFLNEAFNVGVEVSPRKVYFVDRIKDSTTWGLYDPSSDIVIVEKEHIVETLPHELLHHVGYTSNQWIFEPLQDDEYWTEILTRAFLKYANLEDEDVIRIYLDEDMNLYRRADLDSCGKSWKELVEMYLNDVYNRPITVSIVDST